MNTAISLFEEALRHAEAFARSRDYAGADPYDGLTSPAAPLFIGRIPRQLLLQSVKRGGLPLRKAMGIRPVRMAKSMALFAEGYSLLGQNEAAAALVGRLLASQNGGPWGYEFDVQTRWAYYKAGTPNVIATAFVVRALAKQGRVGEVNPKTLDWLYSLIDKRGYFHYTPASSALIHNGSLLAAETVARLGGDLEPVRTAVELTLDQQNENGSWYYGEDKSLAWIDNFHTVYVLESLKALQGYGIDPGEKLDLGIKYWKENLFTRDNYPKYYAGDSDPSRDVHNIATVVGALPEFMQECASPAILHPAIRLLMAHQGKDGGFRNSPRSLPFMRWNQAHAFRALAKVHSAGKGNLE